MSAEGAYSLKLIDKGVGKEALAFLVLFQFPVELASAILAGRWEGGSGREIQGEGGAREGRAPYFGLC